jgi:hypothetical protein
VTAQQTEDTFQVSDLSTCQSWGSVQGGFLDYPAAPLIKTAPETGSLSKLVEQTRESMRAERARRMSTVRNGGPVYFGSSVVTFSLGGADDSIGVKTPDLIVRESYRRWEPQALPPTVEIHATQPAPEVQGTREPPKKIEISEREPAWSTSPGPILERAPAARLHAIAKKILTPDLYRRYVEPQVADMWHEYYAAIRAGNESAAKAVVRRGLIESLKPLAFALFRAALRLWVSFSTAGQ